MAACHTRNSVEIFSDNVELLCPSFILFLSLSFNLFSLFNLYASLSSLASMFFAIFLLHLFLSVFLSHTQTHTHTHTFLLSLFPSFFLYLSLTSFPFPKIPSILCWNRFITFFLFTLDLLFLRTKLVKMSLCVSRLK